MTQGALPHYPGRHQFAHRAEGNPDPGIPGDFSKLLQGGQVVFLLIDERPQLIQLALVQMQVAEEVVHHVLTVLAQHRQPMIGGIFVNIQQASGCPDTQPFRQRRRSAQVGVEVCADPRIGSARCSRNDALTPLTAKTRALALPIMHLQMCSRCHLTIHRTLRATTVAGHVIHAAAPRNQRLGRE